MAKVGNHSGSSQHFVPGAEVIQRRDSQCPTSCTYRCASIGLMTPRLRGQLLGSIHGMSPCRHSFFRLWRCTGRDSAHMLCQQASRLHLLHVNGRVFSCGECARRGVLYSLQSCICFAGAHRQNPPVEGKSFSFLRERYCDEVVGRCHQMSKSRMVSSQWLQR